MAAGRYSFTIEQGSTLNLELQYKDSNKTHILTNYFTPFFPSYYYFYLAMPITF